uniref:C-type lectin domain-containing protein n=1 Tax=Xiphophorus couchianus TaxID=32473 RepID=A0A3B5LD19_9TELE
ILTLANLLCVLRRLLISLFWNSVTVECPSDWTAFNNRCFRFVADAKTWAGAEKNCMSLGGNLASVHSKEDYHQIQTLIFKASRKPSITWIGGSDAQEVIPTVQALHDVVTGC